MEYTAIDRKEELTSSKSTIRRVKCSGNAKLALRAFRKRVFELEENGYRKPNMVAFSELRKRYTPPRQHGELEGVPIGLRLRNRGEAAILGLHQKILSGIDAVSEQSCYAVCVSGGYLDDDDTNPDGTLIYAGHGGRDRNGRQIQDQKKTAVGNAALLRSIQTGLPIRVLRGTHGDYHYDGLYRCVDYVYEKGKEGYNVFKFTLKPLQSKGAKLEPAPWTARVEPPGLEPAPLVDRVTAPRLELAPLAARAGPRLEQEPMAARVEVPRLKPAPLAARVEVPVMLCKGKPSIYKKESGAKLRLKKRMKLLSVRR